MGRDGAGKVLGGEWTVLHRFRYLGRHGTILGAEEILLTRIRRGKWMVLDRFREGK